MHVGAVPALLGIDWGTSNRRAYLIDGVGGVLRRHADGQGLLAVQGGFAASLDALRRAIGAGPGVPVLMSGMVGSKSGWQEAPYLDTATPLAQLPASVVAVAGHPGVAIVPGYRSVAAAAVDVMRGEEMQLLGAQALGVREGWVLLPGTHCKWVRLEGGRIARFATYMTGELFAMLGASGTLSAMLAHGDEDAAAFAAGLEASRSGQPLSHSLFEVRARVVTRQAEAGSARSFVSGLLIGSEFVAQCDGAASVHIIGSPALAERYALAARHFGLTARALDPDAVFIAALQHFL